MLQIYQNQLTKRRAVIAGKFGAGQCRGERNAKFIEEECGAVCQRLIRKERLKEESGRELHEGQATPTATALQVWTSVPWVLFPLQTYQGNAFFK